MFVPGLIKIPEVSRGALPGALGCLCHPGPSFPVARGQPGVPALVQSRTSKVENGISSEMYPAHALFSRGTWPFPDIARPPGHRLTPDRFHPPRKSLLRIDNNFLGTSHFSNFLKLRKKVPMWPKPRFRLFRGQFRSESGPAGFRKCFYSIRKEIPDIPMSLVVT